MTKRRPINLVQRSGRLGHRRLVGARSTFLALVEGSAMAIAQPRAVFVSVVALATLAGCS